MSIVKLQAGESHAAINELGFQTRKSFSLELQTKQNIWSLIITAFANHKDDQDLSKAIEDISVTA